MTPVAPPESNKPSPGHVPRSIERWSDGRSERLEDRVAEEVPVAMLYNGVSFAVMMATPHDLEDFALGFSLSEGLIASAGDLHAIEQHHLLEGIELAMTVAESAPVTRLDRQRERLLPGRGGCGICGTRRLEDAVRQPRHVDAGGQISRDALERALASLHAHQPMNAATGAVHAAAWSDANGNIVLVREDVGRHNALDKLIGAMHQAGIPPESGMLLLTSRASYEMVTKAASAGVSVVAAISAPTALAIELARTAGMTLIGFARSGSHNVYTHPERLASDDRQAP
ncbi:MAG: formate dehydrogenase accessory sulfurtransferase FdhD [Rhodanobacter sp.]